MRGKLLKTFIEVAECGSFSKAEKSLFLSKQAIVKQMDNLEKDLGFDLFYRSTQGVALTPVGTIYLKGIKEILDLSEKLMEECTLAASAKQILRIENQRHPHPVLQGSFNEMKEKHPHMKLDISFSPDHHSGERILAGLIDVAEVPACRDIIQPGISYTSLFHLPYKCLVHENNLLSKKDMLNPEDLSNSTIVVNNPKFRHNIIELLNANAVDITIEKGDGEEIQQIYTACYNNKIYLTTTHYPDSLPGIKVIPINCDLTREFGVIHKSVPSPEVKIFLTIAQKYFLANPLC